MPSSSQSLRQYVRYAPLLCLLPLLNATLPRRDHPAREVAVHFQTVSFLDDPISSFTYITPQESDAALHLYSILSSPLVASGYIEAGRFVSFLAAFGTALLLAHISRELFNQTVAAIAPVLLLLNPFFIRYAWAVMPEALSIFLTTAAFATGLKYEQSNNSNWLKLTLGLVVLAITNHSWEAVVMAPLAVLFLRHDDVTATGALVGTGTVTVIVVQLITDLQSSPANTLGYAIVNTGPQILLTPSFWQKWTSILTLTPYHTALGIHALLIIPTIIGWIFYYKYNSDFNGLLMAAWMLSGGAIPFLLPAGTHHNYYFWGVVVPLTLSATVCLTYILHRIPVRTDTMLRGVIAVLVVLASANILVYETQYLDNSKLTVYNADYKSVDRGPIDLDEGEAVEIGRQIRPLVESPRDIAFVGNWRRQQFSEFYRGGVIRILIYSEVRSSGTWHGGLVSSDRSESPQYASNVSSVDRSSCQVMIVRHDNRSGSVRTC